jgi:cyclic pyranopterin phosphate synthase
MGLLRCDADELSCGSVVGECRQERAMGELTHFDAAGASRMVDVADKQVTARQAVASGLVRMLPATLELIRNRQLAKGDVLEVARLAGIMAAKQTSGLIPLCHQVPLDTVEIGFDFVEPDGVRIVATARATGRTGVEMEALVAVSVAGLTIYDMCKAVDRAMVLERVQLEEKSGGKRGDFRRQA